MSDTVLTKADVSAMLTSAAKLLAEHSGELSEIDSRFGDGDHGVTVSKIAKLLLDWVPLWGDESIRDFLDALGDAVMSVKGGSAGPLYGTMIAGLGARLDPAAAELDCDGLRRMFSGSLAEMREITPAQVGDKTMMDALIPAVEAAQTAQGGVREILDAAAGAAEAGAKASEGYVSKFCRAKSYREQTIGTPDAGAASTALFFRGLAQGL